MLLDCTYRSATPPPHLSINLHSEGLPGLPPPPGGAHHSHLPCPPSAPHGQRPAAPEAQGLQGAPEGEVPGAAERRGGGARRCPGLRVGAESRVVGQLLFGKMQEPELAGGDGDDSVSVRRATDGKGWEQESGV